MDRGTGPDMATAPVNRSLGGDGPVGVCVLDLPPDRPLQTCVPRGCHLVLIGVAGATRLDTDVVLQAGRLVLWPRGAPITVQALGDAARVGVVAVPAGAEQVLAALSRGDLTAATMVALAADSGVELVLA